MAPAFGLHAIVLERIRLVAHALDHGTEDIPLNAVENLVAKHLSTSSAESRRKTRTVLLGALEGIGVLQTRGTGQHRTLRAAARFYSSRFIMVQPRAANRNKTSLLTSMKGQSKVIRLFLANHHPKTSGPVLKSVSTQQTEVSGSVPKIIGSFASRIFRNCLLLKHFQSLSAPRYHYWLLGHRTN